ncbi:MAG: tetratricopeptide repeat protein [Bacteroidia bacterium]|nr:tetratricopeptide repeat protein [Bacteroidia bacterium]
MAVFDFQKDVLEKSRQVPVVVDFWAPWCAPCRTLGPVIQQLAGEANGRWQLVKVNTEEHQQIAKKYAIQSIPNVKMFYGGKVIAEFAGNLPKHQIEKWLTSHLPDPRNGEFQQILSRLEYDPNAFAQLVTFVQENPDMGEARLTLAGMILAENPEQAIELLEPLKSGHPLADHAEDIRTMAQLLSFETEDKSPAANKLKAAREALWSSDWQGTLELLIESISLNKNFAGELARKATIAIFHHLGEKHELSRKYRPRFSMALY